MLALQSMMESDQSKVSPEVILALKYMRQATEADRQLLGHMVSEPADCRIRKGIRDQNIRLLGASFGDRPIGEKAVEIRKLWLSYIMQRWPSQASLSLLPENAEPVLNMLHAMSRFNLGYVLSARTIEFVLQTGAPQKSHENLRP